MFIPITLGMRNKSPLSGSVFKQLFQQILPFKMLRRLFKLCGPQRRCPPRLQGTDLICGLVFHVLQGGGTLARNMNVLTGQSITDAAISLRRQALPWQLFESIMDEALCPKADPRKHSGAFYQGLRLCGIDGSNFSVANSPLIKKEADKAVSRRMKAAFAKVGVAVLVELGIHNPIGASIGPRRQSEMILSAPLLDRLPEKSLLLVDRYYGCPVMVERIKTTGPGREFLMRVKSNLKARVVEIYPDGSALVEVRSGKTKYQVREIQGTVRKGKGKGSSVRLWTSLLDWRQHPATVLLELYGRRWEQEGFYRELKVDMRSAELLNSHTLDTAAQEVAALVLAYSVLVEERLKAAEQGEMEVLRVSFRTTLRYVRGLWQFLEVSDGVVTAKQVRKLLTRTLRLIARWAVPKRRHRSCPRALRQPVSSWPRLIKNTYKNGPALYQVSPVMTRIT